jgi:glutathione S-transferase
MQAKLYVVAASHPCWAAARALELKGIEFKRVEWAPGMHFPIQKLRFGRRTVPGLVIDGERIGGSRPIMHRLDELVPEPRLYPDDPRVEEADRWGEEVLQPVPRRLTWWGLRRRPAAILSYAADSRLPFPPLVTKSLVPAIAPIEWWSNKISDEAVRADLEALPGLLDKVDGLIADGVIGGRQPNAADLQIGSSLALLATNEDLQPLLADRPCGRLARELFPDYPGRMPAGTFPASGTRAAA